MAALNTNIGYAIKKKLYFTGTINDLNIELVTLITTYPYNWYLNENLVTKLLQR